MWHRWLWMWALFLVAGVSHAQVPAVAWDSHSGYGYSNSPGKVTVTPTAKPSDFERLLTGRSYTPGAAADKALVRDLLNKPSNLFGGANPLPGKLEREVAVKAAAKGVARLMPLVGTALLIGDVLDMWESTGCKFNPVDIKLVCDGEYSSVPSGGDWVYWVSGHEAYYTFKSLEDLSGYYSANMWRTEGGGAKSKIVVLTGQCEYTEYSATYGYYLCPRKYAYAMSYVYVGNKTPSGYEWQTPDPMPTAGPVGIYRQKQTRNVLKCEWEVVEGECVEKPSFEDAADRVPQNSANRDRLPTILPWIDEHGGSYETGNPKIVDLPPSISGGRYETTNNPDGSVTTKDRDYLLSTGSSPSPTPTIIVQHRDTVTTWPSGTTPTPAPEPGATGVPPVGAPAGGSQSSTTSTPSNFGGGGGEVVEFKSCGLPETPPCKIDESGTPEWEGKDGSSDAGGVFAALGACLADVSSCVPALPDLSWSFSLPNTCAPIPVPAFAPYLTEIDICPYQPVIHDLMSMVWAAAGLFAGISMIGRDARASI